MKNNKYIELMNTVGRYGFNEGKYFSKLKGIIWWLREDLQFIYPLNSEKSIISYLNWFNSQGVEEYNIPKWLRDDYNSFSINEEHSLNTITGLIIRFTNVYGSKKPENYNYKTKEKYVVLVWLLKEGRDYYQLSYWTLLYLSLELGIGKYFFMYFFLIIKKAIDIFTIKQLLLKTRKLKPMLIAIYNNQNAKRKKHIEIYKNGNYKPPSIDDLIIKNKSVIISEKNPTGVNVIGFHNKYSGIAEATRTVKKTLTEIPIPFRIIDYEELTENQYSKNNINISSQNKNYRGNIFCLTSIETFNAFLLLENDQFNGRYSIGYWHWELPKWPKQLYPMLSFVNEIWVSSMYEFNSLSSQNIVPVYHMPHAFIPPPTYEKLFHRDYFKLPKNRFLFFFSFNFSSLIARKNPIACIRAFQKAFPEKNKKVSLIIHAVNIKSHTNHTDWIEVINKVKHDHRIHIIHDQFTKHEMWSILNSVDAFISLHRSEGLGRLPAEAMLLGKPVILTNYSGNTDYARDYNSCTVNYKLIDIEENEYIYGKGQKWAEPEIEHAAWYMNKLVNDSGFYKKISIEGKRTITEEYNCKVIGKKYYDRLKFLNII